MDLLRQGTFIFLFIQMVASSSSNTLVTVGSEILNEASYNVQNRPRSTYFSTQLDTSSTLVVDGSRYVTSVRHSMVPSQNGVDDTLSSTNSAGEILQPTTVWITNSIEPSYSGSSKISDNIFSTSIFRVLQSTSTILTQGSENRVPTISTALFQSNVEAELSATSTLPAFGTYLATTSYKATPSVSSFILAPSSSQSVATDPSAISATNTNRMPSTHDFNTLHVSQLSDYVSNKILASYEESNYLPATSPTRNIRPLSTFSTFSNDETLLSTTHRSESSADSLQLSILPYKTPMHLSHESVPLLSSFSSHLESSADLFQLSISSYQSSVFSLRETSSLLLPLSSSSERSADLLQFSTLSYQPSMHSSGKSDSLVSSFSFNLESSGELLQSSSSSYQSSMFSLHESSSLLLPLTSISERSADHFHISPLSYQPSMDSSGKSDSLVSSFSSNLESSGELLQSSSSSYQSSMHSLQESSLRPFLLSSNSESSTDLFRISTLSYKLSMHSSAKSDSLLSSFLSNTESSVELLQSATSSYQSSTFSLQESSSLLLPLTSISERSADHFHISPLSYQPSMDSSGKSDSLVSSFPSSSDSSVELLQSATSSYQPSVQSLQESSFRSFLLSTNSESSADLLQLSTLSYQPSIHRSRDPDSLFSSFSSNLESSTDLLQLSTLSYHSSLHPSQEFNSLLSLSSYDYESSVELLRLSTLLYQSSVYSPQGSSSLLFPFSSNLENSVELLQPSTSSYQPSVHSLQESSSLLFPLPSISESSADLLQFSTLSYQPSIHSSGKSDYLLSSFSSISESSVELLQLSTVSYQFLMHPSQESNSLLSLPSNNFESSVELLRLSTLLYQSSVYSPQGSSSLLFPFSSNSENSTIFLQLSNLPYQPSTHSSQESSSLLSPSSPHLENLSDTLQQFSPLELSTAPYTSSLYSSQESDSLHSSFPPHPLPSSSLWQSSTETTQSGTIIEKENSASILWSNATSDSATPHSFIVQSESTEYSLSSEKRSAFYETEYSSFQFNTMSVENSQSTFSMSAIISETPQGFGMQSDNSIYSLTNEEGSDISEIEYSSIRYTSDEENPPFTILSSTSSASETSPTFSIFSIHDVISVLSSSTENNSDISETEYPAVKSSNVASEPIMSSILLSDLYLGQETTPLSDLLSKSSLMSLLSPLNEQISSVTEFESFPVVQTTSLANFIISTQSEILPRTSQLVDVWTSQAREVASTTDFPQVKISSRLMPVESFSVGIFTSDITSLETTRMVHSSFRTSDFLGNSVPSPVGSTLEEVHAVSTTCFQCASTEDIGSSRIFSQMDTSYASLFERSLQSQTNQFTYSNSWHSSASEFTKPSISQGTFEIASSTVPVRLAESSGLVGSLSSIFSFPSPPSSNEKDFPTSALYTSNTTVMPTPISSTHKPDYKSYNNLTLVFSFRGDCKLIAGNTFIFRKFWRALLQYTEEASNMTISQHDMSLVELGCDPFHAVVSISVIKTVNLAKIMNNYFHSNTSLSEIFIRLNNGTKLYVIITHYEFTSSSRGHRSNAGKTISEIIVITAAAIMCGILIAFGAIIAIRECIRKRKFERFRFDARGAHEARNEHVSLKRLPSSKSDMEMQDNGSMRGSPFDAEYSTISSHKMKKTNFMTQADMNHSNRSLTKKRGRKSSNTVPSTSTSNGITNFQSYRGYGLVIGLLGYKIKSSEPAVTYAVPDKKTKVQGLSIRSVDENTTEIITLPTDELGGTNCAPDGSPTPPPRHLRTIKKNKEVTASGERLVPKTTKDDDARKEGVVNPAFTHADQKDDVTGSTASVLI